MIYFLRTVLWDTLKIQFHWQICWLKDKYFLFKEEMIFTHEMSNFLEVEKKDFVNKTLKSPRIKILWIVLKDFYMLNVSSETKCKLFCQNVQILYHAKVKIPKKCKWIKIYMKWSKQKPIKSWFSPQIITGKWHLLDFFLGTHWWKWQ